jgi:hypothetical protein
VEIGATGKDKISAFIVDLNYNKLVNPNGLPLKAGTPNTLVALRSYSGYNADATLAAYYDSLKPGSSIPVKLSGYTYTNPVQNLGCITFNLIKPLVSAVPMGLKPNFGFDL